jgi:cell division control protein 6
MSNKSQTTISFTVRKSGRNTNKINYNEKLIEKSSIGLQNNKPIVSKCDKSVNQKKTETKSRIRKYSNNKLDENKDELSSSPSKLKKSSDNDQNLCSKEISLFAKTKQLLSPSIVDYIIGRDSECDRIKKLIESHLNDCKPMSLYISGPAGTGKTLSVNHVINRLHETIQFKLININCMSFRNTNAIFNKIFKQFDNKKNSKQTDCLQSIKSLMTDNKSNQMIVLILDEIDQLESKSQEVLNNIFLWPQLANSKLILIGIANALDFTTRTLSRLKAIGLSTIEEMHFMPYNKDQIVKIIENRIEKATNERNILISSVALQLCARKIASCSGDIRKALDVCRRAIDLVESKPKSDISQLSVSPLKLTNDDGFNSGSPKKSASKSNCVDIQQIMSVLNQVYGQRTDKTEENGKQSLPFHQQIILCALLVCNKQKKLKSVKLCECYQIFVNICEKRGISYNGKNEGEFMNMCQLLDDYGFVTIKNATQSVRNAKLSLRVDESEIEHSLSDKAFLKSILQQSGSYVS